ncbi:SCRB6 [Trypoxylus dichotomus]
MEFRYAENAKYLILALVGIIMSCLGYLTYLFSPLELIVDSMTTLRPGHFIFNLWTEPPMDVLAKMYIFNVTNPQEFLAGREKLRVEEIGPYVYQEILKNTEAVLTGNDTLTYKPVREHIFRPDLSVGSDDDVVTVPNIPLLGIGSYFSSYSMLFRLGFNAASMTAKEFVNITIKQYLWGYEDHLVTFANTFMPHWIDFPTFGIMDRLTTLDKGNSITINLKEAKDQLGNKILPYSIARINGSPGLKEWNYQDVGVNETSEENSKCNTVEGAFEAGLFPKNLPENTTLRLYRRAFCRPVTFNYENKSIDANGFEVFHYRTDKNYMASGDDYPENKCYCVNNKCLPNGFSSLSPCYYGIPIVISQPHFYNADENLLKQIDGLEPDREKHDTTALINPNMGLAMSAHLRVQVNLLVADSSLNKVRSFRNLMVPLLWIELEVLPPSAYIKFLLNVVVYIAPITQTVLMWLLGILGISMVAAAALIVFYFPPMRRLEDPYGHRIGYSPILVIPLSNRLRDTRIS